MLIDYTNGQTSVCLRVKVRQDNTGAKPGQGFTGLTNSSTGLIVSTICDNEAAPVIYTAAGSTIDTIATLGTYATPSANHCNLKKVDDTNNPGLIELQLANARFAVSSAKELTITISGVSGLADCDVKIPLRVVNPYASNFGTSGLALASSQFYNNTGQMTPLPTSLDPWTTTLPGPYGAGTAGAILGQLGTDDALGQKLFPGATVSGATSGTSFTLAFGAAVTAANLVGWQVDLGIQVASPSIGTITGAPTQVDSTHVTITLAVALSATPSVGASVSLSPPPQIAVDTSGHVYLAAAGLDSIVIETGVNARQALSPILAACAGVLSGANTGTVVINGGNVSTTRVTAITDTVGNRTSVTLNLPS